MATAPSFITEFDPWEIPAEPVKRFTVDEYHHLIRAGVLTEDDPYELIEGWLVRKMTKNPPHEYSLSALDDIIAAQLTGDWLRRCQLAVTLPDGEPEPDIALVSGPRTKYIARHPTAAEISLVIEIADVTLSRDRGPKLRSYARAGIPQYWIVNLSSRQVEVYKDPNASTYAAQRNYDVREAVSVELGQTRLTITVNELFPPS